MQSKNPVKGNSAHPGKAVANLRLLLQNMVLLEIMTIEGKKRKSGERKTMGLSVRDLLAPINRIKQVLLLE